MSFGRHSYTVGLLGFGAVPQRLAPVLAALGARVLFWNRSPRSSPYATQVDFTTLLQQSDVLSLHLPLVPETTRLIDAAALAQIKRGAILINTARGGLVDEVALIAALRSGQIAAAGLDVFAEEPPPADHPLFALDTVVLAPHVAWLTPETFDRSLAVAVDNCRRLARGEPLLHRVA